MGGYGWCWAQAYQLLGERATYIGIAHGKNKKLPADVDGKHVVGVVTTCFSMPILRCRCVAFSCLVSLQSESYCQGSGSVAGIA
jgi:hypothetical protein